MHALGSYGLSILGGALIGLAASLVMLLHGRVAGVAGLFGGALLPAQPERAQRVAFVAGLVVAGFVVSWLHPAAFAAAPASWVRVVLAGLLVGYGTRLGGGCTSGHGVCGIARLSTRSIVATMTFMALGVLTVFVVDHLLGGAR